jgi:hypothetical protein
MYSTWYEESGLPVDLDGRAKAIRELWAFISKPRTLPSALSHQSSSGSAAGNRALLTPLASPPAQDEAMHFAGTPKRYPNRPFSEKALAKPLNTDGFHDDPLADRPKTPQNNHVFSQKGSSSTKPASHLLVRASNPDLRKPFSSSHTPITDSFQQAGLEVVSNPGSAIPVQWREEPKQSSDNMTREQWTEYEEMQHQSSKWIMSDYETDYEKRSFTAPFPSPVGQPLPDALALPNAHLLVPTHEPPRSRSANSVSATPFTPPITRPGESSSQSASQPKSSSLNLAKLPRGTEFRRKLVIVGESACGKTCLLMCVTINRFPYWTCADHFKPVRFAREFFQK